MNAAHNDVSAAIAPTQTTGAPAPHQSAHAAPVVDDRRPPKAKTGLWIAIGGVLAAGAGAGIFALASRGGGKGGASTDKVATARIDAGTPVVPAPVDNPPGPQPDPVPAPDPWSGGDLSPDQAADLDKMLDNLPADLKKGLPPPVLAAMKKYGGWSKIPDAERKKLLALVTQTLGGGGGDGDMGLGDMAGAMDQINGALAGADSPPKTGAPIAKADDGWVKFTDLGVAQDPKNVDVAKAQAYAIAQAKKVFPDATLYRLDAIGVFPDGHADLTAVEHGSLIFKFIVKSRLKVDKRCAFMIDIEPTGTSLIPVAGECDSVASGPPKCSARQIWKKAIAKGAPVKAAATLEFRAAEVGAAPAWSLQIHDDAAGLNVDQKLPDDC